MKDKDVVVLDAPATLQRLGDRRFITLLMLID